MKIKLCFFCFAEKKDACCFYVFNPHSPQFHQHGSFHMEAQYSQRPLDQLVWSYARHPARVRLVEVAQFIYRVAKKNPLAYSIFKI